MLPIQEGHTTLAKLAMALSRVLAYTDEWRQRYKQYAQELDLDAYKTAHATREIKVRELNDIIDAFVRALKHELRVGMLDGPVRFPELEEMLQSRMAFYNLIRLSYSKDRDSTPPESRKAYDGAEGAYEVHAWFLKSLRESCEYHRRARLGLEQVNRKAPRPKKSSPDLSQPPAIPTEVATCMPRDDAAAAMLVFRNKVSKYSSPEHFARPLAQDAPEPTPPSEPVDSRIQNLMRLIRRKPSEAAPQGKDAKKSKARSKTSR